MVNKSVGGAWKAVVFILFFLSELILCAGILANIQSVCTFLDAHGLEAVTTFLHRTLYFLIEIGAAVLLVVDTMVLGVTKVTRKFPSLMTVLAFIYNDIAAIAAVFGLYMFGQPRTWFPYPLVFLIPAITFLLALICLIDDLVHDEGVVEAPQNVTKLAGQQAGARVARQPQPAAPVSPSVVTEQPAPRAPEAPKAQRPVAPPAPKEEPAFFVTPASAEQWAETKAAEPEVVPATESVQAPAYSPAAEPVVTSSISADHAAEDAVAAVDDLFASFLGSDYVEDDLAD